MSLDRAPSGIHVGEETVEDAVEGKSSAMSDPLVLLPTMTPHPEREMLRKPLVLGAGRGTQVQGLNSRWQPCVVHPTALLALVCTEALNELRNNTKLQHSLHYAVLDGFDLLETGLSPLTHPSSSSTERWLMKLAIGLPNFSCRRCSEGGWEDCQRRLCCLCTLLTDCLSMTTAFKVSASSLEV